MMELIFICAKEYLFSTNTGRVAIGERAEGNGRENSSIILSQDTFTSRETDKLCT
jgi:hypothetical protein